MEEVLLQDRHNSLSTLHRVRRSSHLRLHVAEGHELASETKRGASRALHPHRGPAEGHRLACESHWTDHRGGEGHMGQITGEEKATWDRFKSTCHMG